jgi:hypothetical protein
LKIPLDSFTLVRRVVVSGKNTGMLKVISINKVLPYFNATDLHVRQSAVAVASSLIVFSVNSYGITGIVPMETDVITRFNTTGIG